MIGQGLTSLAGHDPLALNRRKSIMNATVTTVTLSHEAVQGAALVGKIVKVKIDNGPETYDQPYEVHSVEGPTWYAFAQDDRVTVDDSMTLAPWLTEPEATIVPVGSKIGEGFARTISVSGLSVQL